MEDGPLTSELKNIINDFVRDNPGLFHIVSIPENVGLGLALACGIKECRNELVSRMDTDDYSDPKRCEEELRLFQTYSDLDIVGCFEAEFCDSISNVTSIHKVPETSEEIDAFMHRRCAILHPTVIYKKSAVLNCGSYKNIPLYEDYDLFIRMLKNHAKAYNLQKSLYYIRINQEFYKRRGGIRYLKTVISFKRQQYKNGYFSLWDYLISAYGQAFVCLLPNRLRIRFYTKFLR